MYKHVSVLLTESVDGLRIKPDGTYVDCTLGGSGHSRAIRERLSGSGRLIGIDQDAKSIETCLEIFKNIEKENSRIQLVQDNFVNIKEIFGRLGLTGADGFLLDLGVSSHQLDEAERGFSYMQDAPLDMRMDRSKAFTAWNVVNEYDMSSLNRIIWEYGEERWAKRIAEFIVEERKQKPIETTFELVSVIKAAVPKGARGDGPHPAKRTFQAIRIEVNGELEILDRAVRDMVSLLNPGGRICVITFHSLEDRIIKQTFKNLENPCVCPRDFPVCMCGKKPSVKVITRKPVLPDNEEIEINSRARSAKLRIAEKI